MTFDEILDQAIQLLRKRGRLTHRALQRQFEIDAEFVEDLVHELVHGQQIATDDGSVLSWNGDDKAASGPPAPPAPPAPMSTARDEPDTYTPKHLADRILRDKSALEGEIKQVSVLFCDLAGSTRIADRIGAEDMHTLLSTFFELSLGVVHSYEGTINQFLGDGFMALFGAPIACEDHARRALRTAVALQRRLDECQAEVGGVHGVDTKIRIGVHSGRVVVGGIGNNLRMDYTAIGDTTNVAARLQALAQPGETLVSEAIAHYVMGDANLEILPPTRVKGKDDPIVCYRVLSLRRPNTSTMDLPFGRSLSSFVGRDTELTRLLEIARTISGGKGQTIMLSADPGVGKSRLAYELRQRLAEEGQSSFEGRCVSFEHRTPYRPLLDLVRQVADIAETDRPTEIARKLAAYLKARSLPEEQWGPYMRRVFDLHIGTEGLEGLSPEAIKSRTFEMFRQLVRQASYVRPLVLMIEDLHWIDATSEACLTRMVEESLDHRILFVFTYRPGYRPPWMEQPNVTTLELRRLTAEHGRSIVNSVIAQTLMADNVLDTILARAEGNPFFLEELTRSVLESGGGLSGDIAVPATVEGVITSRIDRLPEANKRLLQTAAVLGRSFSVDLLRRVHDDDSGGIEALLTELQSQAFVTEDVEVPEPSFSFRHALTQDVAYNCILQSRRRAIHAAAGAALELMHLDHLDDAADELAYHYSHAGIADKAVHFLCKFAARAASGYSHQEATDALREALTHTGKLEEGERDRRTLEIVLQLAESLYFMGKFPETLELLEEQRPRLDRLGDDRLGAEFHFHLAHTCSYVGRMPDAFAFAGTAIELAQRCGDKRTEGRSAYVMERASFWSGRFEDAIRFGEQAITAAGEAGDPWWQGQALWMIGWSRGAMGNLAAALADERRTREVGESLQDPRLPCYADWTSAVMLAMRGDYDAAIEEGHRGLERSPDALNTGVAWGFTGFAHLESGAHEKAAELLEKGAASMEQMRFRPLHGWFRIWLGDALLRSGSLDAAEQQAGVGVGVCTEIKNWWGVGMGQRVLGRIALARGDHEQAARQLGAAMDTFKPIVARYWAARVHLDLAELAHLESHPDRVVDHLRRARSAFAELGCEHWASRSDAVAESCSVDLSPR